MAKFIPQYNNCYNPISSLEAASDDTTITYIMALHGGKMIEGFPGPRQRERLVLSADKTTMWIGLPTTTFLVIPVK